jgi:hypothetical protein
MLSRMALPSVSSYDPSNDNLWRSFGPVALRVRVLQAATESFPLLLSHTLALMMIRLKGVCIFQKDDTLTYTYVTPIICRLDMSKVYQGRLKCYIFTQTVPSRDEVF